MTKEEVSIILGKPDHRASPTISEKENWEAWWYEVFWFIPFLRNSELYVRFDPHKVGFIEKQPDYPIKFNSDDWKRSTSKRRDCMVEDLLKRHRLEGLSKRKILDLLGEPDRINDFGSWDFAYRLGLENSLFPIDNQWLVIEFSIYDGVERIDFITD
ncbi:MAG: hypothetical protein FK732_09650 [Asgard group archaeon]|nr:hypothetical protein [Asgard group archaeon]